MMWSRLGLCVALIACGGDDAAAPDGGPSVDADPNAPLRVQWERLGDGPPFRETPYVTVWNDKIVLFGGAVSTGVVLDDTWIYDGTWSQVTPAVSPPPRSNGTAATAGGRVVISGGFARPSGSSPGVSPETWTFDGTTWAHLTTADLPPLQDHASTTIEDKMIVFGGVTPSVGRTDKGYILDLATGAWTDLPAGPSARRNASLTTLDGAAYLTGGAVPGASAEIFRFDGTTWTDVGPLPRGARAYHGSAPLAGRLVVFGGVRVGTDKIAETDAWPGGVEVVGDEPPDGSVLLPWGDDVLLWRPTATGSELWRLRALP